MIIQSYKQHIFEFRREDVFQARKNLESPAYKGNWNRLMANKLKKAADTPDGEIARLVLAGKWQEAERFFFSSAMIKTCSTGGIVYGAILATHAILKLDGPPPIPFWERSQAEQDALWALVGEPQPDPAMVQSNRQETHDFVAFQMKRYTPQLPDNLEQTAFRAAYDAVYKAGMEYADAVPEAPDDALRWTREQWKAHAAQKGSEQRALCQEAAFKAIAGVIRPHGYDLTDNTVPECPDHNEAIDRFMARYPNPFAPQTTIVDGIEYQVPTNGTAPNFQEAETAKPKPPPVPMMSAVQPPPIPRTP